MKPSKIDRLILDDSWKGACTRVLGIALVYLGLKYLPDAVAWSSIHWHVSAMSPKQIEKHGAILFIFKIVFGFALAIEAIKAVRVLARRRSNR
ncbi:hypothetical protein [Paraburkholderia sp. SIMBA_030]|uniref:hypothetical protein n=1 Tax=Paraburkholderia sp. SIMBA_030 TaxID=3085773 RepID=UPI00397DD15B